MSDVSLPVILMLEYDPDDRFITTTIFREHEYLAHLEFVDTSKELFAYLDRCRIEGLQFPSVILINFNAVPVDGCKILRQLKVNIDYRHLPVVVLSDSKDPRIVKECYTLGASSFIQKPDGLSGTDDKIRNFFKYWFETVVLS